MQKNIEVMGCVVDEVVAETGNTIEGSWVHCIW